MKIRTRQKIILRSDESEQDSLFSAPWEDGLSLFCLKEKGRNIQNISPFYLLISRLSYHRIFKTFFIYFLKLVTKIKCFN